MKTWHPTRRLVTGRFSITIEHSDTDRGDLFRDLDPLSPDFMQQCDSMRSSDDLEVTTDKSESPVKQKINRFSISRSHITEEEKIRSSGSEKEFIRALKSYTVPMELKTSMRGL